MKPAWSLETLRVVLPYRDTFRRGLRLAFWSGHSHGRYAGSSWYEAAKEHGFDSVWTTDHVILPVDQAGPYAEILEPLMTLAYVAAWTKRVKLGVSILVVPQRNGVVVAKEVA